MPETSASLKQQAIEKTGLSDFGTSIFEAPLSAWVADLNGPIPNERGRKFYSRLAVTDLCRRLRVIECLHQHPEIDEVEIPPIIYITGHERSGTTLLHNLLSLDQHARTLKRWELMHPTPPPEASSYLTDPRIAKVQAPQDKLRGTLLEHMHWVDANDPEECTWGLLNCTGFLGQSPSCVLPTWGSWIQNADFTETFREYRSLIKLLLLRNPVGENGYLVLKAPQHARPLQAFAKVFPEAHFVITHRDPFRVFTSLCSLVGHTHESFLSDSGLLLSGGAGVEPLLERTEAKLNAMIEHDKILADRISNVAYLRLVDDPYAVIRQIYDQARGGIPDIVNGQISAFLNAQKVGRRAKPPREMPTFGIDHQQFLKRDKIAPYCRHFQVQPELTRATGA
jgi:hypothetical protein